MEFNTKEEILSALSYSARYINSLFPLDCTVAVTDGEYFVAAYPGEKIDPGARAGDKIASDDINPEVMRTGKIITAEIPEEAYGFPFKAVVVPVKDPTGQIIGTFDIGFDLTTQNELVSIAEHLRTTFFNITAGSQELASTATELNSTHNEKAVILMWQHALLPKRVFSRL